MESLTGMLCALAVAFAYSWIMAFLVLAFVPVIIFSSALHFNLSAGSTRHTNKALKESTEVGILYDAHTVVSWLSVEQWQVNLRGWGVADGVWRGRGRKRGIPIPLASIHGCIITHNRMGDRACVMRALTHIMTLYNYCARGHVLYRTLVILFLLPRRQLRVLKTSGLLLHSALNTDFIASFMMKWKVLISELYTVHIYMCGFLSGSPCHAGYIIYFYMLVYYSLAK